MHHRHPDCRSWRSGLAFLVWTAVLPNLTVAESGPSVAASGQTGQRPANRTNEMQAAVDAALADAARRTGLDRAALVVVVAEPTLWPNGALGCPSSGRSYTQAQVPGYRIHIQAGDQTLSYHAGGRLNLVLCQMGNMGTPAPNPNI